jgi:hypothetical protein
MFVIFESIATNDSRWSNELVRFGNFWIYTIAKVPDNFLENYDIKIINGQIINDNLANASIFANAVNEKISVRLHDDNLKNPLSSCCDETPCSYSGGDIKVEYQLTDQDKKNTVDFIKTVLKHYSDYHILDNQEKLNFISEIDSCNSIEECNWILYHYLDLTSYNTQGPKQPKFLINWK